MAKQIAKLLRTDMMADIDMPALAQFLQKMGRKGDKILAHITPKEAKKLKKEGGSGTINPATGLPEFYDDEDYSAYDTAQFGTPEAPVSVSAPEYAPTASDYDVFQTGVGREAMGAPGAGYAPAVYPAFEPTTPKAPPAIAPAASIPSGYDAFQQGVAPETMGAAGAGYTLPALEDKNFLQKYWGSLTDKQKSEALLKGGLGIGAGLLGGLQGRRAAKQVQQARGDIEAIGRPYQQQGQEAMAQARRGELTPASQQRLQAARAALAQGVERRGGVGAQQAATQIEAFRQQLLDNQYNYGLKIAQIGDAYVNRAIQVGLTQDREMSSMMQGLTGALAGFLGSQPNQPRQ